MHMMCVHLVWVSYRENIGDVAFGNVVADSRIGRVRNDVQDDYILDHEKQTNHSHWLIAW